MLLSPLTGLSATPAQHNLITSYAFDAKLGEKISEGGNHRLFLEQGNAEKIIKVIRLDDASSVARLKEHSEMLNHYYGAHMAEYVTYGNTGYLRMSRLPGVPLNTLNHFPANAEIMFLNMLAEMENKNIYPAALSLQNLLYCSLNNRFYPINISNTFDTRRHANAEECHTLDTDYRMHVNLILEYISTHSVQVGQLNSIPAMTPMSHNKRMRVFRDADNAGVVWKKYSPRRVDLLETAKMEAAGFNRYYGTHTAQVFQYKKAVFIRMLHLPGIALDKVRRRQMGQHAESAFATLLQELRLCGIMHHDLQPKSLLYHTEANRFYPINIINDHYHYQCADRQTQHDYDSAQQRRHGHIIDTVRRKQPRLAKKRLSPPSTLGVAEPVHFAYTDPQSAPGK